MKHAGAAAFEALSDLLKSLRSRTALIERRPGIFYVSGKAFLHFHEDPAGLFADLRLANDWHRFPVNRRTRRASRRNRRDPIPLITPLFRSDFEMF